MSDKGKQQEGHNPRKGIAGPQSLGQLIEIIWKLIHVVRLCTDTVSTNQLCNCEETERKVFHTENNHKMILSDQQQQANKMW